LSQRGEIRGVAPKASKAARTTCLGTTLAKKPCPAAATHEGYCYWHAPSVPEEEKRAARQRGRAAMVKARTPVKFLAADLSSEESARALVEETINLARAGMIRTSTANAVAKLVAVGLRASELRLAAQVAEIERRMKEQSADASMPRRRP
jgi:hypothetical protein